jgi:F-type H+-transporting ATPase subunit delta
MSQTADRYAKALFELSKEQNNLEAVQNSMTDLGGLILNLENFRQFLGNPLLSYEERCTILKALFEGKIPELAFRFLLFITHKSRLDILKDIIESFDHLYVTSIGQLRACVTTALPVEEDDKTFFNQRLHDKFHFDMLTKWKMDPSLIGGFRIFIQGQIYDYSFKNQLDRFYQQAV